MDIFISWSGPRSGALAEALKKYLPKIVNAFRPWLSSADIDKGARWSADVAGKLATVKAGIICLTPSNLTAPWILFEAGALSKTLENTFVCPMLLGLEPTDVTGPLAQFQATRATKDDMLKLLRTLNRGLGEDALPDAHFEEEFDLWYKRFEAELQKLPLDEPAPSPQRSDHDLLVELVDFARAAHGQSQSLAEGISNVSARVATLETRDAASRRIAELRSISERLGGDWKDAVAVSLGGPSAGGPSASANAYLAKVAQAQEMARLVGPSASVALLLAEARKAQEEWRKRVADSLSPAQLAEVERLQKGLEDLVAGAEEERKREVKKEANAQKADPKAK